MKLFYDKKATNVLQGCLGNLIDNDFLGQLFHDEEVLKDVISLFSGKKIYLHPFTEFEFLRDIFAPHTRILREQFIEKPIFGHIKEDTHQKIFPKLYENAMLLSKIYAHQGHAGVSSFVDLILAGFLMYTSGNSTIITGNKKHFPSCVFDVLAVINIEQNDGSMRAFCLLEFNQKKFNMCHSQLQKVKT